MELQVERQKIEQIMYLEGNKHEKKVSPNIYGRFEIRRKVRWIILRLKDSMKSKCDVFSGYKEGNKVFFVYLECKLNRDSHG